ncbi:hypothetical protein N7462_010565 [Penicillium macrosclerotiorum]|uniref:uncharacterized protein n=1 Tax=Penicillium macrosclerotiorum TaxID=303699 RepID=UPI002546F65F|nr:uncharacterized protein N7462_010565 [Penicillium macrosclerotiorum]KAJ5669495.1 hypothetical protein N7462_010565 [Penicillium macrosclerotiorum]
MALRLLVNTGLLAIPIGGALGTLFGIDAHRAATGQSPLFSNDGDSSTGGSGSGSDSTGGGTGGSGSITNNGVTTTQYCELSWGISPPSDGQHYTLNPNQWGVTDSTSGSLCMNVTTNNNETYATSTTAPGFSVTWQYDTGPTSQPVHAFPNIMIDNILPIELGKMTEVNFDVHWTYGVGSVVAESTDDTALDNDDLQTNVAIDMFFDSDKETAQNSTKAKYEVMVWFADYGSSAQPIGLSSGAVTTKTLNGTTFNLYTGTNSDEQNVLSWVAETTTQTFSGDLYPLITDLYTLSGDVYPSSSDYMGVFQFGTEAFSSTKNVTFWVPKLAIDIQK